ncbi:hypothetical protein [Pseudofrankia inefficax]|uniref:Uncharacterized protein n=1 Tax=Pseudofrankia inefficax (strain DSM 45817 / CECT 9037 / DDB 130130 / EuI1c) TaxID=298654 RepID=E3J6D2_PSEI1|nr:hypothetical protein [Pseudofrankia inefficax]ADP79559.1 hypothetical protein FraEuI1c_1497 [Pseudofrankia inefficax]
MTVVEGVSGLVIGRGGAAAIGRWLRRSRRGRHQLGPRTMALVDRGDGPRATWVRLYRAASPHDPNDAAAVQAGDASGPEPEAPGFGPSESQPCRVKAAVGGPAVTVTIWPGQRPDDLIDQLARVSDGMEFVEVFGDRSLVLVYGPTGVPPTRRSMLRAVVASLGPDDDG